MKKLIVTIGKSVFKLLCNILVFPIVFVISFIFHFPYYLLTGKNP